MYTNLDVLYVTTKPLNPRPLLQQPFAVSGVPFARFQSMDDKLRDKMTIKETPPQMQQIQESEETVPAIQSQPKVRPKVQAKKKRQSFLDKCMLCFSSNSKDERYDRGSSYVMGH